MINAPSDRAPEKAPRWDLSGTEGCGGGIRFSWCSSMVSGYVGIYIGGRSRSVEPRGAHEGGGRALGGLGAPPTSWLPCLLLDVRFKSAGSRLFRKSRSQRFHSVWTLFDIVFLRNPKIGKNTAILGSASG